MVKSKSVKKTNENLTRRDFIKAGSATAAAFGFPAIVPSSVFGAGAPSNRITMGCIGVGGMGTNNMRAFMANDDVQILAVCDPVTGSRDYGHWFKEGWKGDYLGREPARLIVEDYYSEQKGMGSYKGCGAYNDFRELIARDDIDAVTVVTPDHWHAPISIAAARAGKDIYCEKPLTLTIGEGIDMVKAVRRHGVILQTGSHERSNRDARFCCELVRNGYIGELKKIVVNVGPLHRKGPPSDWKPMPIPEGFDYEMWLGPAPWAPYHEDRCLYKFRFIADYSGGNVTNFGAHSIDLAQWGNNTDLTGPVEVEDTGGKFLTDGLFDVAYDVHFRCRYANGVILECQTAKPDVNVRFEGTEGWTEYGYGGFHTHPESLKQVKLGPNDVHLYESRDHHRNFLDCIKTRREPAAPVEQGHRSATVCHLGNIAMKLKAKLEWDPVKERFTNNERANRLIYKPLRAPWHL